MKAKKVNMWYVQHAANEVLAVAKRLTSPVDPKKAYGCHTKAELRDYLGHAYGLYMAKERDALINLVLPPRKTTA